MAGSNNRLLRACSNAADRAREGHLPWSAQLCEMMLLQILRGIGPNLYQAAGMWRRELRWTDKLAHLTPREFQRLIDRLNEPAYRKISQNKLVEKSILMLHAIPTPNFLGYFDTHSGRSFNGSSVRNEKQLEEMLSSHVGKRICFKEPEGFAGRNFVAAEVVDDGDKITLRHLLETEPRPVPEFCRDFFKKPCKSRLIEDYVAQHSWYARLNPDSVNSFRVWALQQPNGEIETPAAYLRAGRRGFLADNPPDSGRLVAPVDLRTGRLDIPFDGLPTRRTYDIHPDSGTKMTGTAPPYLDAVITLAKEALAVFPKLHLAAIDIAVSTEGPVVLELNTCPDFMSAMFCNDALAPTFKELAHSTK